MVKHFLLLIIGGTWVSTLGHHHTLTGSLLDTKMNEEKYRIVTSRDHWKYIQQAACGSINGNGPHKLMYL